MTYGFHRSKPLPSYVFNYSKALFVPACFTGKVSLPVTSCTEMQGDKKGSLYLPGNYVFHPTWNLTQSIRFSELESEVAKANCDSHLLWLKVTSHRERPHGGDLGQLRPIDVKTLTNGDGFSPRFPGSHHYVLLLIPRGHPCQGRMLYIEAAGIPH